MLRSMTGFGVTDGVVAGGRLKVEIRTVNHRHFNLQLKLGPEFQRFESVVKEWLRERIERGHVSVTTRWLEEAARPATVKVNFDRAREVARALSELKETLGLNGDVDLGFVARHPDVLSVVEADGDPISGDELRSVFDAALNDVLEMREHEGEALERALSTSLETISGKLTYVESRAPERLECERDRLRSSVAQLMDNNSLDEARLEQEVAHIADKLDITEETVRLRTHLEACSAAIASNGAAGRRLGFLIQEMLRETNTIGSKANNAEIAAAVISIKEELEKFREQVENVE